VLFDLQFSSEKNPTKTQKGKTVNTESEREGDNSNVGRKEGLCLISQKLKSVSFFTNAMLQATYLASK
jgi:hypothetical protein